jgi:XTP/dITP diphosphohydrolase
MMRELVIATHNTGKVKEFAALLQMDSLTLISAGELNLPEPDETGKTFAQNAEIKSRAAATASTLPALADDSGLTIDALNGAPGIYSARWAVGRDFTPAFDKIQMLLRDKNLNPHGEKAAFICALSLTHPDDGTTILVEGRVDGTLCFPPRGENGFGYDAIFIPNGDTRSFAQMTAAEKHGYSHRAKAVEELKRELGKREKE